VSRFDRWNAVILVAAAVVLCMMVLTIPGCSDNGAEPTEGTVADGAIYTVEVNFTVAALQGPAVYVFPRKKAIQSNQTTVMVRSNELPAAYSMKLVVTGADIDGVTSKLTQAPNAIVLQSGNTINVALGPEDAPMAGNMDILELTLHTGAVADSAHITIAECLVRDGSRDDLCLNTTRGCLLMVEQ
jgi:hypothetical protein